MSRADCRECDGDGGCSACGGTGLGDYALDADDECPDCNGGGVCAWCDGRGFREVVDDEPNGDDAGDVPARDMGGRLPVADDVAGELRMSKWRVGNGVHPPEVFDGETLRTAVLAALARGYLVRGDVADASSVDGAECGSFRVTEAGAVVEL